MIEIANANLEFCNIFAKNPSAAKKAINPNKRGMIKTTKKRYKSLKEKKKEIERKPNIRFWSASDFLSRLDEAAYWHPNYITLWVEML